MLRFILAMMLMLLAGGAQAQQTTTPTLGDQLYMIARAQQEQIEALKKQIADLQQTVFAIHKETPAVPPPEKEQKQ